MQANKPFHVRTGHDYLFSLTSRGTQLVNKLVAQIVTRAEHASDRGVLTNRTCIAVVARSGSVPVVPRSGSSSSRSATRGIPQGQASDLVNFMNFSFLSWCKEANFHKRPTIRTYILNLNHNRLFKNEKVKLWTKWNKQVLVNVDHLVFSPSVCFCHSYNPVHRGILTWHVSFF